MFSSEQERAAFAAVEGTVRLPLYGGDCYAYGLLAAGFADLCVEANLEPYDYMALVPVLEGAGGRITDWHGEALGFGSSGQAVAAGDARVHQEALGRFRHGGVERDAPCPTSARRQRLAIHDSSHAAALSIPAAHSQCAL